MATPRLLLPLGVLFAFACGEQQRPLGTAYEECLHWRRAQCERDIRCLGNRALTVEECLKDGDAEFDCADYRPELSSGDCIASKFSSCADEIAVDDCGSCDEAESITVCWGMCIVPTICAE